MSDNKVRRGKKNCKKELIENIEGVITNILVDVAAGNSPKLEVVRKNLRNPDFNDRLAANQVDNTKTSIINFVSKQSKEKFARVLLLLSKIHSLLIHNQTSTRREIYYENTSIFFSQSQVDQNMKDICRILNTPSWELGILATSKGLVAGPLSLILADGTVITCDQSGGVSIPPNILEINSCTSKAKWILIIEKDAAFQKLLNNDGLSRLGPVIFITAKGYPDVNTRLFIGKLWEKLKIPILCLVDADPYGIEIMCSYRFGSKDVTSFSDQLSCPAIRWLGIHPSDINSLAVEVNHLTERDVRKVNSLLGRSYVQNNLQLKNQIEILLQNNKKAEIEGISQISKNYLTDIYLPNKIIAKEYF